MPIAAGFMVLVFVGSMAIGVVRQYPTYSNGWANLRAFTGGCGLADDVLVEPDTNAGFMPAPVPAITVRWARWAALIRSGSRRTACRNTLWPRRFG